MLFHVLGPYIVAVRFIGGGNRVTRENHRLIASH